MKNDGHLPLFGIGPLYGGIVIALTVAGCVAGNLIYFGRLPQIKIPLLFLGIILIVYGVFLWIRAVLVAKLDDGIKENRLVTCGVYEHVRNPIYSAIMFACTGALCITGNLLFLPLFFVFWALMTVILKNTEEKWLIERFGIEYRNYCKRVNRAIPWFAKKGDKQ